MDAGRTPFAAASDRITQRAVPLTSASAPNAFAAGVAARRSRQSLVQRYRTGILIGAAIFGSLASVVGVVVLILRQRSRVRGVLAHSQVFTQEGGV